MYGARCLDRWGARRCTAARCYRSPRSTATTASAPSSSTPRDATIVYLPWAGTTPDPARAMAIVEPESGNTTRLLYPLEDAWTVPRGR